jgi:uncharacterized protein YjiS (DUF1127 family)
MNGREIDSEPLRFAGPEREACSPAQVRAWWPHPPLHAGWVGRVLSWRERVRGRRFLANLDDHTLRDIGLQRGAVEPESTVSFWRLP